MKEDEEKAGKWQRKIGKQNGDGEQEFKRRKRQKKNEKYEREEREDEGRLDPQIGNKQFEPDSCTGHPQICSMNPNEKGNWLN